MIALCGVVVAALVTASLGACAGGTGDPIVAIDATPELPDAACLAPLYCPYDDWQRWQAAVFVLRGLYGSSHVPPPLPGGMSRFTDVPATHFAAPWIEELAELGISSGCGGTNFCPDVPVTRAQATVLLIKAEEEAANPGAALTYQPPTPSGVTFTDVPDTHYFYAWVEDFAARGYPETSCAATEFCPDAPMPRHFAAEWAWTLRQLVVGDPLSTPPTPATFSPCDVVASTPHSAWIQTIWDEGITRGCGAAVE